MLHVYRLRPGRGGLVSPPSAHLAGGERRPCARLPRITRRYHGPCAAHLRVTQQMACSSPKGEVELSFARGSLCTDRGCRDSSSAAAPLTRLARTPCPERRHKPVRGCAKRPHGGGAGAAGQGRQCQRGDAGQEGTRIAPACLLCLVLIMQYDWS